MLKSLLKSVLNCVFLVLAFPAAALSAFGRFPGIYRFFAHCAALAPGVPGDYLRIAYYRLTLDSCSMASRIEFGSYFAHPGASVCARVYIGSYCVFGRVRIGERTQIASGVQILSGSHQHQRSAGGRIQGAESGLFQTVTIGPDCWIGAGAIVMADVGARSTVGAGAVVTKPVPDGVVTVGIPARPR
jgi:acetyltransferase-like isoleucine patch superfamily enzyme